MFTGPSSGRGQLARQRLLTGAVLLLAAGIFFAYVQRPGDLRGYVAAGNAVLSAKDIYRDTPPGLNTWPPFFSLVCAPLALLDRVTPYLARAVWMILNYGALLLILDLLARSIYGRRLTLSSKDSGLPLASSEILVPLLLTLPYILYHFLYHQVNLVVFALALAGLILQEGGRKLSGGIALGAAAAMKVMPILFVPYLAYRRRWGVAFYGAVAAAAFSLSPVLVFGWNRFWHDSAVWVAICRQNPWGVGSANHSVYAMWDRILGHGLIPFVASGTYYLPMSGEPRVELAWALTVALAGVLTFVAFRGQPLAGSIHSHLEWSVVFLISAVFGPVGWKHYLVVLLLPNALLYAAWRSREIDAHTRRVLGAILLICFLLAVSTSHDLVGKSLAQRLQAASMVTAAALIMLAGLLWFQRKLATQELSQI